MKRVLVASKHQHLLSNLDMVLKHWGYRSLTSHHHDDILQLLETTEPDLVIFDAPWLRENRSHLSPLLPLLERRNKTHYAIMQDEDTPSPELSPRLQQKRVSADIFALYSLTQSLLQNHPRKRLRTGVHLPGMFRRQGRCWNMGQIMTLGTGGMFIQSGFYLQRDEPLNLCIPLLGMKQEIEISGRVLYAVEPCQENNYLQGYGIQFGGLVDETAHALRRFVAGCFLHGIENEHTSETEMFITSTDPEYSLQKIAV
ncbi:MAG: PilZ domain-containing protein [Geoalkalibacter sp.]|jgi:Tfp pilus assembly protein PilZ|uniref:PilZ domain-containing protein n=1 Tax=Geoalkalibacter sp. TaxID=3041440 RepID=UPI002A9C905A|nr:PilZ domain-containing protein [Thermodesulfobacteriota bacterium]